MPETVIAYAWFRSEDYQRIREISDDEMLPTFAEFEAKNAQRIAQLAAQGIRCEKVIVDPDALLAFASAAHAGRIDTKVRSEFAARLLLKQRSH